MPASYPTATFTPSAKANGNTIQVTHITDLDNEVVALEDGIRTGLQHGLTVAVAGITQSASTGSNNFSGPSTLATLSVTGGSTFAGPVTFSSGVTFAIPQTFGGVITLSSGAVISTGVVRQNSLPAFNVWSSATTNRAPASSVAGVNFTSQDFVRGSCEHSTSAASSQVHLASSGLWSLTISGIVASGANDAPTAQLRVFLNDASEIMRCVFSPIPSTGPIDSVTMTHTQTVQITSTCFLTLVPTAAGGVATLTFGATSSLTGLRMSGYFLG